MKIGDVIYVVPEDGGGFQAREIVAETSRSWITYAPGCARNFEDWYVAKRGKKLPKSLKGYRVGTKQEAEMQSWAVNNIRTIANDLYHLKDYDMLLTIARMIGYKTLPEEKI